MRGAPAQNDDDLVPVNVRGAGRIFVRRKQARILSFGALTSIGIGLFGGIAGAVLLSKDRFMGFTIGYATLGTIGLIAGYVIAALRAAKAQA